MLTFTVKADKRKMFIVLAVLLLAVTAAIVLTKVHNAVPSAECAGVKYTLSAATNEERVSFFSQFGWKVDAEPVEIKDVVIPAKFNDVYISYNNIQKEQGLDLEPYAGKTCHQWVYTVKNYPQSTDVRATLLVFDNRVIGGDLSTTALDGFMTGFRGEQESDDYSMDLMLNSSASSAAETKSLESKAQAKGSASSAIPANAWPTD